MPLLRSPHGDLKAAGTCYVLRLKTSTGAEANLRLSRRLDSSYLQQRVIPSWLDL